MIENNKLYLMLTADCNMNCKHCYLGYNKKIFNNPKNMTDISDPEKVYLLINNPINNNIDTIIIYAYGEPTYGLDDKAVYNLLQIVKNIQQKKIVLQTNLMLDYISPNWRRIFYLVDVVKVPFDYKIRFENVNQLIKWYKNLKTVSNYAYISLEITITSETIKIPPEKWIRFLEKLELNEYIDDYIFHMVLPYGKAYDNAKTLMDIKREDFVPWMNGILDHNVIWNRTIGEMRKKFFTGYDLNQTVIQVLTNDGITHKLPLIWKMSCDFIKHECFTCDFKPTCGGSYMGCLWDDNFIRNNKK